MLPASPYCPCLNWKSRGLLYLARSPPLSPHCRHHITVPKRATSPLTRAAACVLSSSPPTSKLTLNLDTAPPSHSRDYDGLLPSGRAATDEEGHLGAQGCVPVSVVFSSNRGWPRCHRDGGVLRSGCTSSLISPPSSHTRPSVRRGISSLARVLSL
jgi:hypothetical protein